MAASVAPIVWPVSLAVASMPPAAPLRSIGAEDNMVRLLGVWKKPKPKPQIAIRQPIASDVASAGSSVRDNNPSAITTRPAPLRIAAGKRSDKGPAIAAAMPVAKGHGVISRPVSTWLRCRTPCR